MDFMNIRDISPDAVVLWQWGSASLNATILFTWLIMLVLTAVSWAVTRRLSTGPRISRLQNLLEVLIGGVRNEIREVSHRRGSDRFLPFIGTLFLFILTSNVLSVVPGYLAPTGSLSTTAALALCVFIAVPLYGIRDRGLADYLRQYARPTLFMLPFNILGEFSRTLALAVRLFGNIMSGTKIAAILLSLAPLFFPILMHALGLLTGVIQAYIFAVLAMVYIASGMRAHVRQKEDEQEHNRTEG